MLKQTVRCGICIHTRLKFKQQKLKKLVLLKTVDSVTRTSLAQTLSVIFVQFFFHVSLHLAALCQREKRVNTVGASNALLNLLRRL